MFNLRGRFFTSKYQIGDRVVHAATRQFGRVIGTQQVGKTQLISVVTDLGLEIHLADRREFMLAAKG